MLHRKDFHDYHIVKKRMFKFAMILMVIGSINYLSIAAFRVNLIQRITVKEGFAELVYFLIGVAALYVMFDRDTYLPFLGRSIFPCDVLRDTFPKDATKIVKIQVSPNSKVVYWASEPSATGHIVDYKEAYEDYSNSGVSTSNNDGIAELKVRDPQPYYVPFKGLLMPHIHYRVCDGDGTLGKVKTIFLHNGQII
jgi:uncharacterized membrane protein YuzA (DUF378 family)